MKKLLFILGLGLVIGMAHNNKVEAQVHVSVNIDIHPAWGPSGYNYVEYYYIPEINVYYDLINRVYYYPYRNRWVSAMYLPEPYWYYDFYSLYKVVLNGVARPWRHNRNHIHLYSGYCYNYAQVPIYYMSDARYRLARSNYYGWVEPRYMPRNYGRPMYANYSRNTRNGMINNNMRSANVTTQRPATSTRSSVAPRSSNSTRSNYAPGSSNNNATRSSSAATRSSSTTRSSAAVNSNSSMNRNSNAAPATRSSSTTRSNATVGSSSSSSGNNDNSSVTRRSSSSVGSSNSRSTNRSSAEVGSSSTTRRNASVGSSSSNSGNSRSSGSTGTRSRSSDSNDSSSGRSASRSR